MIQCSMSYRTAEERRMAQQNANPATRRGWPKGKPRKPKQPRPVKAGRRRKTRTTTKAQRRQARQRAQAAKKVGMFAFPKLPLELLRQVYDLVLPSQDLPRRSAEWVVMDGLPCRSMGLLLANKQVSSEAKEFLYGGNTFTMVVEAPQVLLQQCSLAGLYQLIEDPLPPIKHWQINVQTSPDWGVPGECFCTKESLLSVAAAMAKIPHLQSLKLSVPCLFNDTSWMCRRCHGEVVDCCIDIDFMRKGMGMILAPMNQLRFEGEVRLIACTPLWKDDGDGDKEPDPGERAANQQCQIPRCVAFAASLAPFMDMLNGRTTPLSLTHNQVAYIELKKRANALHASGEASEIILKAVRRAWFALESGHDGYFEKMMEFAEAAMEDAVAKRPISIR
ncbi:MAG: hypothetical protein Q9170_005058 [Blastenia crenularia]